MVTFREPTRGVRPPCENISRRRLPDVHGLGSRGTGAFLSNENPDTEARRAIVFSGRPPDIVAGSEIGVRRGRVRASGFVIPLRSGSSCRGFIYPNRDG